jgi:hypothetical protein
MFDETKRRFSIRRLLNAQAKQLAKHDKIIENAKRNNASAEEIERLVSAQFQDDTDYDIGIDRENTYFVLKMARLYLLPVPEESDKGPDWRITKFGVTLSRQTCLTLLTAIRAEREGRWRQSITWAIATMGVLIALIAVLKK